MSQSERDEEGLRAGYLAVEGQMFWHDDLRIVGDRTGLEVLKHAIDMALIHGKFENDGSELFQTDGEGYSVLVACLPEEEMKNLEPSYHDTELFSQSSDMYSVFQEGEVQTLRKLWGLKPYTYTQASEEQGETY